MNWLMWMETLSKSIIMKTTICKFLMISLLWSAVKSQTSPQIASFDKMVTLYEESITNQLLSTITCSDATDGHITNTALQSVNPNSPCTNCYEILTCGTDECLQYRAGVGTLNHGSASQYLITVACQDNIDPDATEVIAVVIVPNSPPYFNPDSLTASVPTPANTAAGSVIYDVNANDDEGDDLTYSMTVRPSSSSSNFQINPLTGEITSTVDLRSECGTNAVTFEVTVSDGTSTTGSLVIDMPITNANTAPRATNLNTVVQFPEDSTTGSYTMNFVDSDGGPNALTYTVTSADAGFAQFSVTNNVIDVAAALDYETAGLRQTDLLIRATDGFCESEQYSLRLEVTDVNEPPTLTPATTTIEVCEGQRTFSSGLTIVDEDLVDTHVWTKTSRNNRGFYSINPVNGELGTTYNYDIDPDWDKTSTRQTSKRYDVRVTDKGGLTADASVTVNFLECNDNAPRFQQAAYGAATTECAAPGSILRTITATDPDSAREQNNVITYTGSGGAVSVGSGGDVILNQALPAGSVINIDAYAWDQGQTPGPLRSENPAKITIRFLPCPTTPPPTTAAPVTTTTTTTTTTSSSGGGSDNNIAWIVIAALLGTIMLALLAFMLWRYGSLCWHACDNMRCGKTCCRERRRRPVRPVKERLPEKRGPKERPIRTPPDVPESKEKEPLPPSFLFGFIKERYPDDDFKEQPNRNKLPEPADMEEHYPHTKDLPDPLEEETPEPLPPKKKHCAIQ